jgi:hypothetical protein
MCTVLQQIGQADHDNHHPSEGPATTKAFGTTTTTATSPTTTAVGPRSPGRRETIPSLGPYASPTRNATLLMMPREEHPTVISFGCVLAINNATQRLVTVGVAVVALYSYLVGIGTNRGLSSQLDHLTQMMSLHFLPQSTPSSLQYPLVGGGDIQGTTTLPHGIHDQTVLLQPEASSHGLSILRATAVFGVFTVGAILYHYGSRRPAKSTYIQDSKLMSEKCGPHSHRSTNPLQLSPSKNCSDDLYHVCGPERKKLKAQESSFPISTMSGSMTTDCAPLVSEARPSAESPLKALEFQLPTETAASPQPEPVMLGRVASGFQQSAGANNAHPAVGAQTSAKKKTADTQPTMRATRAPTTKDTVKAQLGHDETSTPERNPTGAKPLSKKENRQDVTARVKNGFYASLISPPKKVASLPNTVPRSSQAPPIKEDRRAVSARVREEFFSSLKVASPPKVPRSASRRVANHTG